MITTIRIGPQPWSSFAGHITVKPQQSDSYLADCVRIVKQARKAVGCLSVAITADLIYAGRVNIFERWDSPALFGKGTA